jgi:SAM-dependent methyltransferase
VASPLVLGPEHGRVRFRLLSFLICPECGERFRAHPLELRDLAALPDVRTYALADAGCPWGGGSESITPGGPGEPAHACGSCASQDLETGVLECGKGHLFPVIGAIPRLFPGAMRSANQVLTPHMALLPPHVRHAVESEQGPVDAEFERLFAHTQRSFSSEWGMVRPQDRAWGLDVAARRAMFLRCFDLAESALPGTRVLDAGCGHGEVELALCGTGAEVFAMDLSFSVDDDLARVRAGGPLQALAVHFVQGNIHALPFRESAFDLVHSAGVLHHTPDTFRGFAAVAARVREGGRCYIEVYSAERKNALAHAVVTALRHGTTRLPHTLLHGLCYAAAPFLWAFTRAYNKAAGDAVFRVRTLREAELSLFDGFSPRYARHHTTAEVMGWFHTLGLSDPRKTFDHKNGFGVVGTRGTVA